MRFRARTRLLRRDCESPATPGPCSADTGSRWTAQIPPAQRRFMRLDAGRSIPPKRCTPNQRPPRPPSKIDGTPHAQLRPARASPPNTPGAPALSPPNPHQGSASPPGASSEPLNAHGWSESPQEAAGQESLDRSPEPNPQASHQSDDAILCQNGCGTRRQRKE